MGGPPVGPPYPYRSLIALLVLCDREGGLLSQPLGTPLGSPFIASSFQLGLFGNTIFQSKENNTL